MTVSLPSGGKGMGQFVHNVMYSFKNKKQTEELNSSQIKETSFSFKEKAAFLQNLYFQDLLSSHQYALALEGLLEESSKMLPTVGSVIGDLESGEDADMNDFLVQSEAIDLIPTELSSESNQENVNFTDTPADVIAAVPHPMSHVKIDRTTVELGTFLKRPVQIHHQTWGIGNTIDTIDFDPWLLYFNHAAIKRKLDNYYMVRCNLHLKFVINSSPFYYGCALVSYQPLPNYNPAPVVISGTLRKENIPYSQRPHLYLYPANSQGGEMVLPFLSQKNWLNATDATDLEHMGRIVINSFDTLKNANGVSSDSIDIVVYAWTEEVEVSGPTITLAVQSDEYMSSGAVSKPASAIARAAGRLSDLPIIGPFATATSYAAGAVADIAALFGYTNVPVIDDVHAFYSKPFPNMASTDIGTPIEKLTLDSKNELSIDAKLAGANVNDELIISDFVQRESYIFTSSWASSDPINTSLFYCKGTPTLMDTSSSGGSTAIWGTPMSHVAKCFKYWRGDIIFRFKFICTKYHRGKVRVNFDPFGDIGTSGDYTTEVYTKIVDLTEETDVEFRVPYMQPTTYLNVSTFLGAQCLQSNTSTSNLGDLYNGILTMRVLNKLTSPVTSADIKILVFCRGAENLEFANPITLHNDISPYVVQSESYDLPLVSHQMADKPSSVDPSVNLIYMGETCVSLRQLMRRQSAYIRITTTNATGADETVLTRSVLPRSPLYPGYDLNGLQEAIGLTSGVAEPYNFVGWSYATWFSNCFVGSRGSYIYTLNANHPEYLTSVDISRSVSPRSPAALVTTESFANTGDRQSLMRSFVNSYVRETGLSGWSVTNQRTQSGVTALLPMYSRYKFLSNNVSTRTDGTSDDETLTDSMSINCSSFTSSAHTPELLYHDVYVSIGTDFNLIFFLNVPTLWYYGSIPVGA